MEAAPNTKARGGNIFSSAQIKNAEQKRHTIIQRKFLCGNVIKGRSCPAKTMLQNATGKVCFCMTKTFL
jgi:hypothetical protein